MDASIWVATTTVFPARRADADPASDGRAPFKREFDTQTTMRDHQRIRQLDNGVEPVDRRGFLELGEDSGMAGDNLSRPPTHSFRPLHKGQGNPAQPEGPARGRGQPGLSADNAAIGSTTPGTFTPFRSVRCLLDFDTGRGALRSSLCDPQAHASVVDQELSDCSV